MYWRITSVIVYYLFVMCALTLLLFFNEYTIIVAMYKASAEF